MVLCDMMVVATGPENEIYIILDVLMRPCLHFENFLLTGGLGRGEKLIPILHN